MPLLFPNPRSDPAGGRFVRVAVHRGIERAGASALEQALTYRLDPLDAVVGQLVTVPLGGRPAARRRAGGRAAGTPATGIVVEVGGPELLGDFDPDRVKPVLAATQAVLPARLVELGVWLSQYYVCPLGMVFLSMLPAAVKRQVGRASVVRWRPAHDAGAEAEQGAVAALRPKARAAWEALRALAAPGWPLTAREAAVAAGVSPALLRRLAAAGLLTAERSEEVVARAGAFDGLGDASGAPAPGEAGFAEGGPFRPTLTADQARVVTGIASHLGGFSVHLLRGVTGSGKTEVYLRLIERVLETGDLGAIVLVPEIALTPQTARRFLDRFGAGTVAVLHSGLSGAQRNAQWSAAAAGRVRVVVGARSAVFAPLGRLGLVVVDEEHDGSYKQDQLPRYHARDVAIKRAQLEGCPALLGSATPSLESWANAIGDVGGAPVLPAPTPTAVSPAKYHGWELPSRVGEALLPPVTIVDLADERRRRAQMRPQGWRDRHLHLLGPTLERAIGETLDAGGQVMLLLNRRGYASYLCCPDPKCGWVMRCDHCDVTVVYHQVSLAQGPGGRGLVRCHHCLAEQLLPSGCPVCAKQVNTFGLGTQRVEEELQSKFAERGIVMGETLRRVDGDTMRAARDYAATLSAFGRGEVRMLLGTQMIAKGLDFPNVRLVGVVQADTALNLPDFRAAERTFQLVSQVAGRAGRGAHAGKVIVQTMCPQEPAIVLAAAHDYVSFARRELAIRRGAGLPPAARMVRIVCRDREHAKAAAHAADLAAALRGAADAHAQGSSVRFRGPMPCAISRIDDHHRLSVELLAPGRGILQALLAAVRARGLLKSDAHTAVDVDPIALM